MTTCVVQSLRLWSGSCGLKKLYSRRYGVLLWLLPIVFPDQFLHQPTQGNLSVATTRLLKVILPGTCLWTSLRDVEGFEYDKTLDELKALFGTSGEETMDDDDYGAIPTAIRDMLGYKNAIEALGSMMWCVVLVYWFKGNHTE